MKPRLIDIISAGNTLGEGIQWHNETETVWWTDIQACLLYRYHLPSCQLSKFATPERLCSFGFIRNKPELIVAFAHGFALYDPVSGDTTWLVQPQGLGEGMRFNDGKVDRQGRFWAGAMVEEGDPLTNPAASLYSLDGSFTLNKQASGIGISNGLCWSPESDRLYFADSAQRTIYKYEFAPDSGTISNRKTFVNTAEGVFPDGAEIDCDGCLWSAHWGAGQVVRYTPAGKMDLALDLPVSQPTCVTFAGDRLELLFITSAKEGLDGRYKETNAGDVFVFQVGTSGLPACHFIQGGTN